ncbi:5-oxoprolinase [Amylibacter ulvae]|uniref:5-oxoprolinase n=1 Tax=Paramylibacter ulvae TaxID=1651968 RepID=A0ABQ3D1P6_9RHOB|nr:hydantoinase B/oxoprolinase family protein [Amylibacter ulvae]GHA51644.1 5-oxoprolinase [Amylibacter ulvae]
MSGTVNSKWQFWVDRGGTFTDIVARKPDGKLVSHKLLSENPELYKDAAVQGIRDMLGLEPVDDMPKGKISAVKMGTTVATNALLERDGEDLCLFITAGFHDVLRIGYQNRPRLFDLHIQLPELLYNSVCEVEERLDATGNVLTPLNLDRARADLQTQYDAGLRSVAIAFMHSYQNPDHELAVAKLAREIGFTQISTSHETSKLIKIVGRGDTTVVDAYLSPILRRYVEQVSDALDVENGGCDRLFFMKSDGGLTQANLFQGKDSILSGPAGGVIGMVSTAADAGFEKIIGFDMGGTSTDVCHYAGDLERSFETEVAGVRMRAPMMDIHTVAAGGGSILAWRDGRYQVGPESAGANPGPACYRRGGSLTVTDCNVLLGRLNPAYFPKVFGPNGDQPMDTKVVRQKFETLAKEIAADTGSDAKSPEETAEGFLKIAIENMAHAVKKISVERGHDVTDYTLVSFGGAGGQHACLVADALGIRRVFIHPFAGVLSALGMGLADVRALHEEQADLTLDELPTAVERIAALKDLARAEIQKQGVPEEQIITQDSCHVRYDGSHQTLQVPFGSRDDIQSAFEDAHNARFGFISPDRLIKIDMLTVEAIGEMTDKAMVEETPKAAQDPEYVPVYCDEKLQNAPLFDRNALQQDDRVSGPAVITEPTGTNFIVSGWQAVKDDLGNLIITRVKDRISEHAIGTTADPVMLEVFNNLFMSIAEQMGTTLAHTAYSVNIRERLDFSCALFDATGDLVANAPHVPVHLGSMGESVRTVIRLNAGKMKPGDSYMLNAPFNGGTHLPDVTVITPVFNRGGDDILFYVGSRGHHADIGGRTPGSAPPDSTHIEEEGVVIDNFKLVENGRMLIDETRAVLASGRYPCRNIDQNIADLEAQIAANTTGINEVYRMIDNFGVDTVLAYMKHVQNNAEASVRRVIGELKDGSFDYPLDHGAHIKVSIKVDQENGRAVVDFTGTSDQHSGNYNAPLSICHAVVLYVFRTLVGKDIPMNEGCLKPIDIIAPSGSMINPVSPAAVISGNTEVSQAIADCMYGALGVLAGSQGTMNNFVWGNEQFQNYETIAGGTGAGNGFDGADAVHSHMTNTLMTDPEVLETRFPVRVEEFSIRKNSGGGGRWHGGNGLTRRLRFLDDVTVTTLCSHRIEQPFGAQGGQNGGVGENRVIRSSGEIEELQGNDIAQLQSGDMFEMKTPGGGGFGKLA